MTAPTEVLDALTWTCDDVDGTAILGVAGSRRNCNDATLDAIAGAEI